MRKADRLFQIVNLIRVHQPITAQALAERLEVSVRTVYRYIDDISLSGIPVYGEPGKGYAMHKRFELPPLALSADEFAALALSVNMLSRSTGLDFGQAARSLLAKIEAVTPMHMRPDALPSVCSMAPPLSNEHQRHWDCIRGAIGQQRVIALSYQSLQGECTHREVLPLGLFYWGGKWTVGAWCLLRGAFRDFRVDCIQSARPTHSAITIPPGANLAAYMQHQLTRPDSGGQH